MNPFPVNTQTTSIVINEIGQAAPVLEILNANAGSPGCSVICYGNITTDIPATPGDTITITVLSQDDDVLATRVFAAKLWSTTKSNSFIFMVLQNAIGTSFPVNVVSPAKLQLEHSSLAAADWGGQLLVETFFGNPMSNRIFPDLNNPPYSRSETLTGTPIGVSLGLNGNVNPSAASLQANVFGIPTSGRFQTWIVDLGFDPAASGDYLSKSRLRLYFDDGLFVDFPGLETFRLDDVETSARLFFHRDQPSSSIPSYFESLWIASSVGLATDIAAGTIAHSFTIQPLNYERI